MSLSEGIVKGLPFAFSDLTTVNKEDIVLPFNDFTFISQHIKNAQPHYSKI
jgi:hypothetical protein